MIGTVAMRAWPGTMLPVIAVALSGLGGCALPPKQATPVSDSSEVARVVCFFDLNPFLSFDEEGDPNPEGFRTTVVLASRKTGKGIAADGVVRAKMYRVDRVTPDKTARTLLREWAVDTAGLTTFKSGALGEGYKLEFQWAKEDDVLGHEVEIVVSFEGRDGRVIRSQTKAQRVPPPAHL